MPRTRHPSRHHRRYAVRAVSGHLLLPLEVKVLNMSLTGLAIETPLPLPIGGRHVLTLRCEEEVVQLETVVRWSRPTQPEHTLLGEAPAAHTAGLDFSSELDEKALELLGFLEHNAVIDFRPGVAGRFWRAGEKAGAGSRRKLRLKQLSFSEASIETEARPEIGSVYVLELNAGQLKLEVEGRAVDVKRAGRSASEARIAFQDLSPEAQRTLEEMVKFFLE